MRSHANCAKPTPAEAISICGLASVQLRDAAIGSWALASQEETNRALGQRLEGYRQIIDRYAAAHEGTARLVQTSVDDLKAAGDGQMRPRERC